MARGPGQHKHRPMGDTIAEAFPAIVAMVAKGIPTKHACEVAGFAYSSVEGWLSTHPDEKADIAKARADRDERLVRNFYDRAMDDPKLAMWWLEKRRPEDWGRAERIEITGKGGGPVQTTHQTRAEALQELTDMARTSPEVRAALIQIIRETDPDASR